MKYYLCKLLPPRATFMQDLTPTEMKLMQEHAQYWRGLMERGFVAAFGPVADPQGGYGVGLLELSDDADPRALTADDPTIKANAGFKFEIFPMPRAVVRKSAQQIAEEQMEHFAKDQKENDWGHQPC